MYLVYQIPNLKVLNNSLNIAIHVFVYGHPYSLAECIACSDYSLSGHHLLRKKSIMNIKGKNIYSALVNLTTPGI